MDVRVHRATKSQTQLSMHTKQQPQITVYWGSEMKINPKRKQTFLIIHMMDQTFNNLMIHFIFEVFENKIIKHERDGEKKQNKTKQRQLSKCTTFSILALKEK